MGRRASKSVFRHLLIAWLCVTLLYAQMFSLHMHIQHDENFSSDVIKHNIDVHVASVAYDTTYDTHHQHDIQSDRHADEINVSPDSFVKKSELSTPFILLFLVVSMLIYVPVLRSGRVRNTLDTRAKSLYYLLNPPLRAPPL